MEKDGGIRIQKYLSDRGVCSRRKAEEWIKSGYIKINGSTIDVPGTRFDPASDVLEIDPRATENENLLYFLFNKPRGIVTVNAQEGELEIKNIVHLPEGVFTVGRLDKDSSGLIFLTNDGVAARRIMEPRFDHEKEYEVSFFTEIPDETLKKLSSGLHLFGKKTRPIKIKRMGSYRIRMVLTEGKNRQIRRLCSGLGYPVKKLKRVRILNFELGNLPLGKLKKLSGPDVIKLYKALGLDRPVRN